MSAADEAYRAAEVAIERAKAKGAGQLSFDREEFRALDRIPPRIAELTGLQSLSFEGTKITDLSPLSGIKWLKEINLNHTQINDLRPISEMTELENLFLAYTKITDLISLAGLLELRTLILDNTQIKDLSPLAGLAHLFTFWLNNTLITDIAPLARLSDLGSLEIGNTQITDLSPLASLKNLLGLDLQGTQVVDLAPLVQLKALQTLNLTDSECHDLRPLVHLIEMDNQSVFASKLSTLSFANTPATKRDGKLAELAGLVDGKERSRKTLAYLRTLPPWPEPYTPAAAPDGSAPQPIGDTTLAQAQALSDLTPLAEELVQNPETGTFSVQYKPIEKPDLLGATLGQVADAIEDVLHDAKNGLNPTSLDIRKLRRTLDRYSNDPQRVEMDFTTAHASIARQIACDELPPSDENLALLRALEEGAQGIRATDPAVAVNRRILQEQKLRELSPADIQKIAAAAPVLDAITQGDLQDQMRDDVQFLTVEMQAGPPRLPGVKRDDAIIPGRDEAVRVFGRASRMMIALRRSPEMIGKIERSRAYKGASIIAVLKSLVDIGIGLFNFFKG